jgi:hypothetical protein
MFSSHSPAGGVGHTQRSEYGWDESNLRSEELELDWPMYVSPSLSDESSPDAAIWASDSLSSSSSLA